MQDFVTSHPFLCLVAIIIAFMLLKKGRDRLGLVKKELAFEELDLIFEQYPNETLEIDHPVTPVKMDIALQIRSKTASVIYFKLATKEGIVETLDIAGVPQRYGLFLYFVDGKFSHYGRLMHDKFHAHLRNENEQASAARLLHNRVRKIASAHSQK